MTHRQREPIDVDRAMEQHDAYCNLLANLGCDVIRLPELPNCPDAVFVEDVAVVLDELAILTRIGAESRRGETASVASALREFRPLHRIEAPGTMDGGDVLRADRSIFVGLSTRTNAEAVEQLRAIVEPHGYEVRTIEVNDCLHLKSSATHAGRRVILFDPNQVSPGDFSGFDTLATTAVEPGAANVLVVGDTVVCSASFPNTGRRLQKLGFGVEFVESDELAKAEGALTCCSLLFSAAILPRS